MAASERETHRPAAKDAGLATGGASYPLRLLGFGLIYAWSYCIWETPAFGAGAGASPLNGTGIWLASAIITPLACLAGALFGRRRELADVRSAFWAGPVACMLGTAAAAATPFLEGPAWWAAAALAAAGAGIGPVILILLWACLFARIDSSLVETAVPASFAATFACALVMELSPGPAAIVLTAALPLASGALLLLSERSLELGRLRLEEASDPPERSRASRISIVRAFAVIFGVYAIGCLLPYASGPSGTPEGEAWTTMVGTLFAMALAVGIVLFSKRIDLNALYRWIAPLFAFAIVFAAFAGPVSTALSSILANTVFTGIEIIMVLYFVRLSQKTDGTATLYLGIGESAAYGGVLLGYALGPFVSQAVTLGVADAKSICLVLAGIFTLSTLAVPAHDEVWRAPDAAGAPAGDAPRTSPPVDPFEKRCAQLAASGGLLKREAEVLALLARGRSRPYIRDELFLSKNTVSTHVKHIYQKLGIHSQQELLDLFESR